MDFEIKRIDSDKFYIKDLKMTIEINEQQIKFSTVSYTFFWMKKNKFLKKINDIFT